MRGAFAISIVRFNTKRKNVVWAPAFGGPIGFSLVSLMDNTALIPSPLADQSTSRIVAELGRM